MARFRRQRSAIPAGIAPFFLFAFRRSMLRIDRRLIPDIPPGCSMAAKQGQTLASARAPARPPVTNPIQEAIPAGIIERLFIHLGHRQPRGFTACIHDVSSRCRFGLQLFQTRRLVSQPVVDQDQCHHRLTHRHEAGQQARIVPAAGHNFRWFAISRHRLLRSRQAARWLDGHPADDRHAARYSAEHSAVAIGFRSRSRPPCGINRSLF